MGLNRLMGHEVLKLSFPAMDLRQNRGNQGGRPVNGSAVVHRAVGVPVLEPAPELGSTHAVFEFRDGAAETQREFVPEVLDA